MIRTWSTPDKITVASCSTYSTSLTYPQICPTTNCERSGMMRSSPRSSRSSSLSSTGSTGSNHTYYTNVTSHSDMRPGLPHFDSAPAKILVYDDKSSAMKPEELCDPRSSTETYASTVSSSEDLTDQLEYVLPVDRHSVFDTEAIPSSPEQFAKLFPTARRLLIQHDDSTSDGNMNLRVDTEAHSETGERLKMTVFHLRMKNLYERQFSLRRYCRESGREVCSSRKKYVKPLPTVQRRQRPSVPRSFTTALQNLGMKQPRRQDSGYESDDAEDLERELRDFTLGSEVKADIPTNVIRLEFSNYSQVEVHRHRSEHGKQWDFDYWGDPYSWKRELKVDSDESIYTYDLINMRTGEEVAHILPDKLERHQARMEEEQGSWIPPSSMRIKDKTLSCDLADVVISTGLIVLTDDCIKRRWHSSDSARLHAPLAGADDYLASEEIVDRVFPRHASDQYI